VIGLLRFLFRHLVCADESLLEAVHAYIQMDQESAHGSQAHMIALLDRRRDAGVLSYLN
jgi:hypothetical protein